MCRRRSVPLMLGMLLWWAGTALAAGPEDVSSAEAARMLAENENIYLLDVRTPQEYFDARLEGARLIPIDQLAARLREIPRDRPVLVYCAVGSRSSQAADYLVRQGYGTVYNLFGGIWFWRGNGYPVLQGPP